MTETESNAAAPPTTFHAVVAVDPLRYGLSLVAALVDECRVDLTAEGLHVRAMDPATVAAVEVRLDRAAFERYEATGGTVGVDLTRLSEALGMADGDDCVELALNVETNSLRISTADFEYTLGLLDPASIRSPPDTVVPNEEVSGRVTLDSGTLDRAVDAADTLSDHLTLEMDEETFVVAATGDTDSFTLTRAADDFAAFHPAEADSIFSVDYLQALTRAIRSDTDLDLRLGVEQPAYLAFEFGDGNGSVRYAVAPRLSNR